MSQETLAYGDEVLPYLVEPSVKGIDPAGSSRKRVAIHVDREGSVRVSVPYGTELAAVRQAVQRRARWIFGQVAQARQRYAHVLPREYVSGEQVLYLGRRYVLKVLAADGVPAPAKMRGNRVEVETRSGGRADVRNRLGSWYRARAQDYFARRIVEEARRLPWVDEPPPFHLRAMARQWGNCSASGTLVLSPHLFKAPRECVGYVIVHELAHLVHKGHGREFVGLLDRYLPPWREVKERLDEMAEVLLNE